MIRSGVLLILLTIFLTGSAIGQEFNFYSGKNVLGEKMYGLEDKHGLKVTELKWRSHYKYEIEQFGQPLGVVSEDGENYFFINMMGERVSTFSFPETYVIEDMRMQYELDVKITYYLYNAHENTSNYRYYLNKDCACEPRPYYPCPPRFPMDTTNSSRAVKQVQQMQFILEFYTLDSAVTYANKLIKEDANEPQYHYYKAWLLEQAFMISYNRYSLVNYGDEFPVYMWDELIRLRDKGLIGNDEKLQMYLAQYERIQKEIEKLEKQPNWFQRNKKDAVRYILDESDFGYVNIGDEFGSWYDEENYKLRNKSYHEAIDALTEVVALENEEEVVVLTKAWQNLIIDAFLWEHTIPYTGGALPYESVYDRNETELRKSPHLYTLLKYEKFGPIMRLNGTQRNDEIGVGLGLNFGALTRINKIWTTEISTGLGYNHFFTNNTYGEFYLDFTLAPAGWVELRTSPSILTNYDGVKGVGFLPTIGVRIWDIYLSYGYNFANKSKFNAIRGHSFGLSYGFTFLSSPTFIEKEDGFEL